MKRTGRRVFQTGNRKSKGPEAGASFVGSWHRRDEGNWNKVKERKMIPNEVRGVIRGQTLESLIGCGEDFTFYCE